MADFSPQSSPASLPPLSRRRRFLRALKIWRRSNKTTMHGPGDSFGWHDIVLETPAEREAREANTRQNSLAPIARLPPEILADIFCRCVPTSISDIQIGFKKPSSWLAIPRVTTYFRDVALASPDFWSTVVLSPPQVTATMLIRSRSVPLIIRADLNNNTDNSPEPIILEHTARLGTLHISSPRWPLLTFLSNLEHAEAAPHLQCLQFVNNSNATEGESFTWLPRNFFRREEVLRGHRAGSAPGLHLHLNNCAFPWDSLWYRQITHLHLEKLSTEQRPSTLILLSILAASPGLQTLALIDMLPVTPPPGLQTVSLPYLMSVTLKDNSPARCRHFLRYLQIPPLANVYVSCRAEGNGDYSWLIRNMTRLSSYNTVSIKQKDGFVLRLSHSSTSCCRHLYVKASEWTIYSILATTEGIVRSLAWQEVTTLHLHGFDAVLPIVPDGMAEDRPLFLFDSMGRLMENVHTIHFHGGFPTRWLDFMLTQAMMLVGVSHFESSFARNGLSFRGPDGALSHSWPRLARLCLHGVNFEVGNRNSVDSELSFEPDMEPTRASILHALLWARRQGGAPLRTLDLMDKCKNIPDNELSWFNAFVDVASYGVDGKQLRTRFEPLEMDTEALAANAIGIFASMVTTFASALRKQM